MKVFFYDQPLFQKPQYNIKAIKLHNPAKRKNNMKITGLTSSPGFVPGMQ